MALPGGGSSRCEIARMRGGLVLWGARPPTCSRTFNIVVNMTRRVVGTVRRPPGTVGTVGSFSVVSNCFPSEAPFRLYHLRVLRRKHHFQRACVYVYVCVCVMRCLIREKRKIDIHERRKYNVCVMSSIRRALAEKSNEKEV